MDGSRSIPGKRSSFSFLLIAAAFIAVAAVMILVPSFSDDSDGFDVGDYSYEVITATDNDVRVSARVDLTNAVIPGTVIYEDVEYDVVEVTERGFYQMNTLVSLTFSENMSSIGEYAFFGCPNLSYVRFPSTLTKINDFAFSECSSLESIVIPAKVSSIGDQTFFKCEKLATIVVETENMHYVAEDNVLYTKDKKILITYPLGKVNETYSMPNTVETVGRFSLYYAKCKNVVMSNVITKINDNAFQGSNIVSITIPESVANIGNNVFIECLYLESITVIGDNSHYSSIDGVLFNQKQTELLTYPAGAKAEHYNLPNSVVTIREYSFYLNKYLKEIDLYPQPIGDERSGYVEQRPQLKSIGNHAFYGCTNLQRLELPSSVSSMDQYAFGRCSSLRSVLLSSDVKTLDAGVFSECSSIKVLYILSTVTIIGNDAFYGCTGLEYLYIPSGVSIYPDAFRGITFLDRDGITVIGPSDWVFSGHTYYGNIHNMVQQIGTYSLVHYDENGGSAIIDDEMIKHSTTFIFPEYEGTLDGHTFSGWMYGNRFYEAGDAITSPMSNTVMTAVWTEGIKEDVVEQVRPDFLLGITITLATVVVAGAAGYLTYIFVRRRRMMKDDDDSWWLKL